MLRIPIWTTWMAAFAMTATISSDARPGAGDPSAPPAWMTSAYGARDSFERAYTAPARDQRGVRLVVNGRLVDLSGPHDAGDGPDFGDGLMRGTGLLGGPTLTATAIGNSAEITNVSNSTIVLNQTNVGVTMATAGAGGGK